MQQQFTNRTSNTTLPAQFEDYVTRTASEKLDPMLASFTDDAVLLKVVVDEANRRGDVEVLLHLALPQTVLNGTATGSPDNVQTVFDTALSEVRRQLRSFKDKLNDRQ